MIKSLIYIRIAAEAPTAYSVPLIEELKQQVTGITTFEFDNFSEESIRQYAIELLKQSQRAAIVVVAAGAPAGMIPATSAKGVPDAVVTPAVPAGGAGAAGEPPITGLTTFFNRVLKVKPPRLLMALQGEQPLLQKMMQAGAAEYFYHNLQEQELKKVLEELFS
jgi:DNA-binding NarL/FixJ family response regulator